MLTVNERLRAAAEHRAAGRTDEAMLLYESVLDQSPNNADALKEMALVLIERGEVEKATQMGARAANIAADNADILEGLSRVCLAAGKEVEAEAVIDRALTLEPSHPPSCLVKAQFCTQRGEVAQAESLLAAALEKEPEHTGLLVGLSMLYQQHGLQEPALAYAQRARTLAPDDINVKAAVGQCLAASGNAGPALPLLEQAYLAEPKNPMFMLAYASALADAGELTEADRLATRAKTIYPQALPAWQLYVAVKQRVGGGENALREFTSVASSHPQKSEALLTLATAYRQAGNIQQALKLVQPLLETDVATSGIRRHMAQAIARDCLLCLGRYDLARDVIGEIDLADILGTAMSDEKTLLAKLADAALLVDSGLSSLETIVLLRFWLDIQSEKQNLRMFGTASLRQLVAVFGEVDYTAIDRPVPVAEQTSHDAVFPLSCTLALPTIKQPESDRLVPYVQVREDIRNRWMQALGEFPRPWTALAWSPNRPGLVLEDYRAVFEGFTGTLVGLMWDNGRHQLAEWPEVIDAGVHMKSLHELVGALSCADIAIGPDGIAMHIAGAMGRPGAVLTQPGAPWYWRAENGHSTWYPSLDVLCTDRCGKWADLMDNLEDRIRERINWQPTAASGEPRSSERLEFGVPGRE